MSASGRSAGEGRRGEAVVGAVTDINLSDQCVATLLYINRIAAVRITTQTKLSADYADIRRWTGSQTKGLQIFHLCNLRNLRIGPRNQNAAAFVSHGLALRCVKRALDPACFRSPISENSDFLPC